MARNHGRLVRAEPLANPVRPCWLGGHVMGLRRSWWMSFFGLPHGLPGRFGVRLMSRTSRPFNTAMAAELDLQPDDEVVDIGCGSGTLLADHATHVRSVAGIDASALQIGLARHRLAARIDADRRTGGMSRCDLRRLGR